MTRLALACALGSTRLVAVTVTGFERVTDGDRNSPELEIVPAVVDQDTAV